MANHGTDASKRFGLMRERVEAMKAIWTQDDAEYHGKRVDFDAIWSWPKPLQKPHPPVLVGGNGRTVYDRVLAFGDGWLPNRIGDDEKIIARVEKLQRLGKEAGRDSVPVTMQLAPRDPELLERYEKAGVTRAVYMLPAADAETVETKLDRFTAAKDGYTA
jgi:alkanesulfonate monooxygenase SsuD/methylene tetrahydromethanopterin reductase-like flavin-dependent oxidoreductase (luciferase family)